MKTTDLKLGLLAMVLAPVMTGCFDLKLGESTRGDEGNVDFSYGGQGCFFGCALDEPLAVGSSSSIAVTGAGNAATVTVESTRPDVIGFEIQRSCACTYEADDSAGGYSISEDDRCPSDHEHSCHNTITANALASGEVKLRLVDAAGALIDQVSVEAATPQTAQLELARDEEHGDYAPANTLQLQAGESVAVRVAFIAADGQRLRSDAHVTWTLDDDIASFGTGLFATQTRTGWGVTDVVANRAGETRLRVSLGDFSQSYPLVVQP